MIKDIKNIRILRGLVLLTSAVLIFYILYILREPLLAVFYPLFFSIVIAYLLNPLVIIVEKKGFHRVYSILIVYLGLIALLTLLGLYIVPLIISELNKLIEMIPYYTKMVQEIISNLRQNYVATGLPETLKTVIDQNLVSIEKFLLDTLENVMDGILGFFSRFFSLIITPVLGFYILKDLPEIKKNIMHILPGKYQNEVYFVLKDIDESLGQYIRGQLLISFFVALLTSIGLFIIKIEYALIIGLVAGIANIIPYFGPIIGAIPALVLAALKGPTKILLVLLVFVIVQQIETTVISPKIMQNAIGIHPIIVILSLIFGGQLMGFWGMLLAIPVTAVIKVLIKHLIYHLRRFDI